MAGRTGLSGGDGGDGEVPTREHGRSRDGGRRGGAGYGDGKEGEDGEEDKKTHGGDETVKVGVAWRTWGWMYGKERRFVLRSRC